MSARPPSAPASVKRRSSTRAPVAEGRAALLLAVTVVLWCTEDLHGVHPAIIALGAIGVSFSLQILKFANFAHSELLTWGAYLALVFVAFALIGLSSHEEGITLNGIVRNAVPFGAAWP